ncbi:MAG TPA: gamma-glutamyltransferase [Candidatus Sulfotelmatobacter sp.]|nr:gamma-glutamyltransferase [Candidatus Sulfotelmatobacter sp.]
MKAPNRLRTVPALALGLSCLLVRLGAADREQARSMVISTQGIVAAESPLAAQAGVSALEQGGNAIDAAIAANAVMGVVAPMMDGIGGDLFAIVYDAKSRKLFGLNASGWAPQALTIAFLREQGVKEMPSHGVHSITVPGAVDGWQKLAERFGRKPLAGDLAAAIRTAENGFPVPELTAADWAEQESLLRGDPAAAATYLVGGRTPQVGEVFRNPDLARSLRLIAQSGRDGFYRGETARRILERIGGGGGMSADDLEQFSGEWVEPISTTYRGWTVFEIPPNGQGIAALMMLNIMERFPLGESGFGTATTLHTMIEAKKLAYADMRRYIGEPRNQHLPVATLLGKPWAGTRAAQIDPRHANQDVAAGELRGGNDTTYLCAVDREGNMISLIQSNSGSFGSGVVAPGTGFVLQNRGSLFSLDPASPNALAGRKRPLHTIIPAFARKGAVAIAFGIIGGWNQPQAHAQFVANVADYGMNIQSALEAPRFTKQSFTGNDVELENRFTDQARAQLAAMGHDIRLRGAFSSHMGGGQAVERDFATGVNYGASDPRKDGAAVAESP